MFSVGLLHLALIHEEQGVVANSVSAIASLVGGSFEDLEKKEGLV